MFIPTTHYCIVSMSSSTGSNSDSDDLSLVQTSYMHQPATWFRRIVTGPELQFCSDGTLIPIEMQEYIWIPEILCKLHVDKISAPLSTFQMSTTP